MMRKIETFPSKQMYPYLSLVERKEAEFYHNIDRRHCGLVRMTYFHPFFQISQGCQRFETSVFFSEKINISTTGGSRVGFFQPDTNHP